MTGLLNYLDLLLAFGGTYYYFKANSYKGKFKEAIKYVKHYDSQLKLASRYNKLLQQKLPASTQVTQQEIDNLYKDL